MKADQSRPLRLCLVSADYPTFSPEANGGIGRHTYTLAHAVADLGHDVSVLTEGTKSVVQQAEGPIQVHAIPQVSRRHWKLGHWLPVPWLNWSFAVQRTLRRLHAKDPFDIVVFPDACGEGFRFSFSPFIPFVVRFGGPASVLQHWDGRFVPATRARIEFWIERQPAARASLLQCASRPFVEEISRAWSLEPSRFRIIRNPLNLDQFRPAELAFRRPGRRVLFVGHIQPLKGLYDLTEAIPLVAKQHPDVHFQLVGNDTKTAPGRSSLRTVLEQKLREHGALERVSFMDPLPQPDLVPLYQSCAVFVLPSHNDVYPNAVLEAMGCGRPCIVTNTVGVAELVAQSGCGFLVPPHDPPALAAALSRILAMPESVREEMGARGRRLVESVCARSVVAAQAVEVYREAIERYDRNLKHRVAGQR